MIRSGHVLRHGAREAFVVGLAGLLLAGAAAADEPSVDVKKQCADRALDGQRLVRQEKLIAAREALSFCARDACPSAVSADCRRWLADLLPSIPTVVFYLDDGGSQPTVRVWIDGEIRAEKIDGKSVDVDPGVHEFRFDVDGVVSTQAIVIRKGQRDRRVDVPMPPARKASDPASPASPAPPKPVQPVTTPSPSTPVSAYVFAGVGVAAISVAGYLGVTGLSKRADLRDSCAPRCDQSEVDATRRKLLVADVVGAVGVLSLGAAAWIYLDRPSGVRMGAAGDGRSAFGLVSGAF